MHCGAAHFMFVNIIRSVFLFFSHKNVLLKIKEMQGHKFSFWLCFYHVNKVNYADNCSPKMSLKPHVYWTFFHVFSICCIAISFWVVTKVVSLLLRHFVFRIAEASAKRVTGDELQGTMGMYRRQAKRLPDLVSFSWQKSRFLGTAQFLVFLSLGSDQF